MEATDQLVMPIVVPLREDSTHIGTIQAVAGAVTGALDVLLSHSRRTLLQGPDLDLQEWLDTGMRKSVRGVKAARYDKVVHVGSDQLRYSLYPTESFYVGSLKTYDQFTPFERRTQVSGWDLREKAPGTTVQPQPHVPVIEVLASLSTGKAAAAAAHVTTMLALVHEQGQLLDVPSHLRVRLVDSIDPLDRSLAVFDAGHTEVEPQTVTAALRLP